jgi:hypothetical protein
MSAKSAGKGAAPPPPPLSGGTKGKGLPPPPAGTAAPTGVPAGRAAGRAGAGAFMAHLAAPTAAPAPAASAPLRQAEPVPDMVVPALPPLPGNSELPSRRLLACRVPASGGGQDSGEASALSDPRTDAARAALPPFGWANACALLGPPCLPSWSPQNLSAKGNIHTEFIS